MLYKHNYIILFKKGDVKSILAYIELLLPFFCNVDWFSLCTNFV